MDRQQARQYLKNQLESYLLSRGLNPRRNFRCLNPDHPDRHPSMSFDRQRKRVHCFACGRSYDLFDLIGLDHGLSDPAEIFQKAYELYGLTLDPAPDSPPSLYRPSSKNPARAAGPEKPRDYRSYFRKVQARLGETDYPARRGLSPEITAQFGLGFDPAFRAGKDEIWSALIIPTGPHSFTARNTDPEAGRNDRIRKRGSSPLFNSEVLDLGRPVFVVEGELDALSVHQAGGLAVALGSTANGPAFLSLLETGAGPGLKPLLLALDNDKEGRRAAETLKIGLQRLARPFLEVNPYGTAKDAGEALSDDPEAFSRAVAEIQTKAETAGTGERESYLATSAVHHLAAFRSQTAAPPSPYWPTGFPGLDGLLDGGFFEGLYVLGGLTSLGKTSLALQMADQMAEAGRDVLIFSLEMARRELLAKSLSRLTLTLSLERCGNGRLAWTARELTRGRGEGESLLDEALEAYGRYAGRLFISEGVGNLGPAEIRREAEKHLAHTGRRPAVIVDYLQILAPWSERASDKRNTDQAVLELKRLSRDFQIPVLALSSFNRAGYREAVTMEAFKESGAIEYSSDVLLGLQLKGAGGKDFDAGAAKDRNPRQVELVILKNRHGPSGPRVGLEYYPGFNFFREEGR